VVILFEKIWWRLLTANIFAKHGEVGNQSLGRPVLSLFSNYKNAFKVIIAFNNLWNGHCLIWISVLCTCTYLRLDFSVMACITQTCCSVITMLEPYSIIKFVYMIINIVFLCIKWILGGVGSPPRLRVLKFSRPPPSQIPKYATAQNNNENNNIYSTRMHRKIWLKI
jgi:hypothetical protein